MSFLVLVLALLFSPQQTDLQRAHEMVIHWQQIVYPKFEDARAFISEENTDILNAFMSGGAVTSIRDRKTTAGDVKKADEAITRFANAMIGAATRQPDGSRILDAATYQTAREKTCPLYPFCTE
ncbi:MAG: hypothetical protein HY048_14620 [Acidobacteria bacterium]|nr:hypothetical protein [Acidobacteriota bacterium]